MRTRLLAALAVVILAAGFAPAPRPRKPAGADMLKNLQGTWEIVSVERPGQPRTVSETIRRIEITGNRYTVVFNRPGNPAGLVPSTSYEIKLDTSKSPTFMDLELKKDAVGSLSGIVRVEGNTARFCYVLPRQREAGRPTAFDKMAPGHIMMTYRRVQR